MPQPIAPTTASASATTTADALRAELAPAGLLQRFLVDQMAQAMDRLTRAAALDDRDDPARLREQAQAERSFYKAMAEFRRLVKADARAAEFQPEVAPTPAPRPVAPPRTEPRASTPVAPASWPPATTAVAASGPAQVGRVDPEGGRRRVG